METKKAKIIGIVALVSLALIVVSATYAYFSAVEDLADNISVEVNTATTDVFTFSKSENINITADQYDFGKGMESKVGEAFVQVSLTANNSTNSAIENYYLYLNIESNTFTYAINESTPELIFTIVGPDGELKSLDGLTYKTVKDNNGNTISGFDVTRVDGLFAIANNREIKAGSANEKNTTVEEKWKITLTYVNYNQDQSDNGNASLNVKVLIQKEKNANLVSDVCSGGENLSDCIINLSNANTPNITRIYHHDGTLINGVSDNSYRYSGSSIGTKNYVCFGSTEEICPTDNLYRIIGVFENQVKLIKANSATKILLGEDGDYCSSNNLYYWNYKATGSASNTWSTSLLNKTNLNTNFINNIGSTWASIIATTAWKVGGNTTAKIYQVPKISYENEIVNPVSTNTTDNKTEYNAKIGLMYISDYAFASDPSAWSTSLYYYDGKVNGSTIKFKNWMYIGYYQWTISRISQEVAGSYTIRVEGSIGADGVRTGFTIRPTFYLEPSVIYSSGAGTSIDPIRVVI